MTNNRTGRRPPLSLGWTATAFAAVVLTAGVLGGLGLRAAGRPGGQALLPAVLLALAGLGVVWLSRARAARRMNAALSAYAEREIARARGGEVRG